MIYHCTKKSLFKTNDLVSKKYFKSLAKFFMASFQVFALVFFTLGTAQIANAMECTDDLRRAADTGDC